MVPSSNVAWQASKSQTSRVTVVGAPRACRIIAAEPIEAGELLFPVDGVATDRPSRYSIQIDDHTHIDVDPDTTPDGMLVRYPWRFLNHSCEPNAVFRGRDFVALRPIAADEEVTYNYNTTEYDIAAPFECRCGHKRCIGVVSGFAHLPLAERRRLRPWLADHLRRPDSTLPFGPA